MRSMMTFTSKLYLLAAAVLLLALGAASFRTVLQEQKATPPPPCDPNSGPWKPWEINCDWSCPAGDWELDCDCNKEDNCASLRCKADRDGAPDSEDIRFNCTVPAPNQVMPGFGFPYCSLLWPALLLPRSTFPPMHVQPPSVAISGPCSPSITHAWWTLCATLWAPGVRRPTRTEGQKEGKQTFFSARWRGGGQGGEAF